MFYSPLRYPGGKSKLAKLFTAICSQNKISEQIVEPYAGGASISLHALMTNSIKQIILNDYDRSIYAFWYATIHQTNDLCNLIQNTPINITNWNTLKNIQKDKQNVDLLTLGFSTLFLNRTNRSGILRAGMIGGKQQQGKYKIDCRFNKKDIISRIQTIARQKERIKLYNIDALSLIQKHNKPNTIIYLDPPYYVKGDSLYAHAYQHEQHQRLSQTIKKIDKASWVLSYDNVQAIRDIYHWVPPSHRKEYQLFHRVFTKKQGQEILFLSKNLQLPQS